MASFGDILSSLGDSLYNAIPSDTGQPGMGQPPQQPQAPQQSHTDLLQQLLASIGIHPHYTGGVNYLGNLSQGPMMGRPY